MAVRVGPLALALLVGFGCREHRPDRAPDRPPERAPIVLSPPSEALASVELQGVPFVRQKPDFCGEACVEMAARRLGQTYDQDVVFAASGVDPALGRGAYTRELTQAVSRLGFDPGQVWWTTDAAEPTAGLDAAFAAVHADLVRGVPSILCMHYDESPGTTEHFRLVVGYDRERDEIIYQEPAKDDGASRRMSRARLYELWPLKYQADSWALVKIALAPGKLVTPAPESGFSRASYAQHVMQLRARLAARGHQHLNVRIEEPFVVLGNDPPDVLERRSETVRWAVKHLEKDFFDARPNRILDVFLFGDDRSYEQGVLTLTGSAPTTPYGFYSSRLDGLFMNIATGGGTLVHEIVHPYVEADFEDAPAWLNEGLGSLFEQSAERNGHIVGLTNWRLTGLKRAIRKRALPTFKELAAMNDDVFYADDRGDNYAQSRYLFYYMQEQGLLVPFYEAFRANRAKDRTGYTTLVSTLKEEDMAAFQSRWEAWVMTLRYP
ncbi:MAG: DUF1570 domain-containing protein [Polyangiaceae bacterium]|nr:DUF1570 domain-containing protein [Polyangiaceae bacterium]